MFVIKQAQGRELTDGKPYDVDAFDKAVRLLNAHYQRLEQPTEQPGRVRQRGTPGQSGEAKVMYLLIIDKSFQDTPGALVTMHQRNGWLYRAKSKKPYDIGGAI